MAKIGCLITFGWHGWPKEGRFSAFSSPTRMPDVRSMEGLWIQCSKLARRWHSLIL